MVAKLLTLVFLIIPTFIQAQWVWKSPYPQGNNIHQIFTENNNTLFGTGDYGTIISSTNSGTDWNVSNKIFNITNSLSNYIKIDEQIFLLVSDNGVILKSTNAGINWITFSEISVLNNQTVSGVNFPSEDTGYVITTNGKVVKTINKGIVWEEIFSDSQANFNSVIFLNNNTGFVSAGENFFSAPNLYKTTNGGVDWEVLTVGNFNILYL